MMAPQPQTTMPHEKAQGAPSSDQEHNSSKPAEFDRASTGFSVIDGNSIHHRASGRTYHGYKEGKGPLLRKRSSLIYQPLNNQQYFIPNDGLEQERLDMQHTLLYIALDEKLFLAPIDMPPQYVLDVATGTGIWATEFALQNPASHVIGTDLSRIQRGENIPNVEFIVEDSEEEWVYPGVPYFDYVHLRAVFSCFTDPMAVMKHAFKNLRPGGWIEYQDALCQADGAQGTAVEAFWNCFARGLTVLGRKPYIAAQYRRMLREVGFVDVTEKRFHLPVNPWPSDPKFKLLGEYLLVDTYNGARGFSWKSLEALGMSAYEIETLISQFRHDVKNTAIHGYHTYYVVYGRKPLKGEKADRIAEDANESVEIFEAY